MDRRIRVLHLFYTFDVEVGGGGLSLFAIELGKNLDRKTIEVSLSSLGYYDTELGKERIERLNKSGIKSYEAAQWNDAQPYDSFWRSYKFLSEELAHNPVDIIHSHSEYTDITAMLLKIRRRVPKIIRTVHYGYRYEWSTKPLRRLLLTNGSYPVFFDKEVGINYPNTDRLNRRFIARILGKQAVRIPNAISFERFGNVNVDIHAKKESLGIPPQAMLIGTVGRLADQKAYQYLIDAASILINENHEYYFIIVGDGPLADEHQAQIYQLGIGDRVILTGGRTDVEEILVCMDLFVSSSLWEGLPTVLLEAMASDIPIVATDIPGTNELIHHAIDGWLVTPGSAIALSEGIKQVITSPSLRKELSKNARETMKNYSIQSIAKEYQKLYMDLVAG